MSECDFEQSLAKHPLISSIVDHINESESILSDHHSCSLCETLLSTISCILEGNETAQDQVVTENQATEPLAAAGNIYESGTTTCEAPGGAHPDY